VPLYGVEDAESCLPLLRPVKYDTPVEVAEGLTAVYRDAGHILGAAMVRLEIARNGETRSILFSGDVGRWDKPILRDPTLCGEADYVLVESTYGNRLHEKTTDIPTKLADVVNDTHRRGGNVVIPSFAIERAQELLYALSGLLNEDRIPHLMVFLDSPMAIRVTKVFEKHPELFDEEALAMIRSGRHPCDFPGLKLCRTVAQSKAVNHIRGTSIVIAGSGMCTGGRIKHHLANNISRPESTVLFVGYQANGTLGRVILEGKNPIRIFGQQRPVEAKIDKINGFSAHADRDELLRWLGGLKRAPRHVFVTHGEPESAASFASLVKEKNGWSTSVARYEETAVLE
jgi:metallo-beta-lactamase family protein